MRHEWDFAFGESRDQARRRIVDDLNATFAAASGEEVLEQAFDMYGERLALVSSFGAESVVLLDMVARIDRGLPVLFLDTEFLFAETIAYQEALATHLGLSDIRRIKVDPVVARLADPQGDLHARQPDDCCHLRKTVPLDAALQGFDAWITGRKRYQTPDRADMGLFELDEAGRIKVNPLAGWARGQAAAHIMERGLPPHPLIAQGYRSIGCAPCTSPVTAGEDERAGRWRGAEKTECGIHIGPDGKIRRTAA